MKTIKKFLIYFAVILVSLQVLFNLIALIDRHAYDKVGFYLNTFIGTNVLFAIFLVAFTFSFKFCLVSRACAVAELLFGINYLIVQQDNLYNILFQVIVGVVSLIVTYFYFTSKFPLCRLSLLHKFLGWIFLTGSCAEGLRMWEKDIESIVKKTNYGTIPRKHS